MPLVQMAPILDRINSLRKDQAQLLLMSGRFTQEDYDAVTSDIYQEVELGVVEGGLNFHNEFYDFPGLLKSEYPTDPTRETIRSDEEAKKKARDQAIEQLRNGTWRCSYIVADNVEQMKSYWKRFLDEPGGCFVISITRIDREPDNAGKGGGWRWHKWGEYIGTFVPQCEYLDDEVGIDFIYVAHIYEMNPSTYNEMTLKLTRM